MNNGNSVYNALILNDYAHAHYATWLAEGIKTIETRMRSFSYRGDLIICCGNKSVTPNKGKAICMVELWETRPMTQADESAACIEVVPHRISHLLRNWRHFSEKFDFIPQKVSGTWQGIFQMTIPVGIQLIPKYGIVPPFEAPIVKIKPMGVRRTKAADNTKELQKLVGQQQALKLHEASE